MGNTRGGTSPDSLSDCVETAELAKISWERLSRFHRPEDSIGYLLWQVAHGWVRRLNAALVPLGLTHLQFILMASTAWLARSGNVSQARLANFCSMDPMLVSKTLRTLERHGMLTRKNDPDDSRAKQLTLTRKGLSGFLQALAPIEEAYDDFFAPLGETSSEVHRALLKLFMAIKADSQAEVEPAAGATR
jgi:DNA-binding MarR family transcriptional regulator